MKRTVNRYEFEDAFREYGRSDSFSYEGKRALYDYLEQYEEDTGEEIELDVIGLCCNYSEYETALEAAQEYGFEQEKGIYYLDNMDTIELTIEEAKSASHQGKCDDDVQALSEVKHVRKQLDDLDEEAVQDALKDTGAWEDEELEGHEQNLQRLLWIAAGDIVEEYDEEEANEQALEWLQERTIIIKFDGGVIIQGF